MSDYPPNMSLRPLVAWPRTETQQRKRSPFKSTWSATITLLRNELRHLHGSGASHWSDAAYPDTVLQLALREQDFRKIDGLPRANSIPSMPGVILNIESKHGPLSYACDAFDRWQDNLRGIALSLEALRRVDRYGTNPGSEQYTGWKSLPPAATAMTVFEAKQFLRKAAGGPDGDGLDLGTPAQVYRRAKIATHPDRHGGDHTLSYQVEEAATVLRTAGELW